MASYDDGLISVDEVRSLLAAFAGAPEPAHAMTAPARWSRRRLTLITGALAVAGIVAGSALAATSWLTGSPAPLSVQSDFGSYAGKLGFGPEAASAVLVASEGTNQLYATINAAGSYCVVLTTLANPASQSMGGGECVSSATVDQPIVAGVFPVSSNTLALAGRVSATGAASVQVQLPDGTPLIVPLRSSGFFLATFNSTPCQNGDWSPHFATLNSIGTVVATSTIAVEKALSPAADGCWLGSLTSQKAPSVIVTP